MAGVITMTYRNTVFCQVYLAFTLMLSGYFTTANAAPLIQLEGRILSLSRNTINVNDMLFNIIPTVKIFAVDGSSSSLENIRVGHYARIEIQKYNGQLYVDSLYLMTKPTANEQRPPDE
jgi:hypothetical protein